MVKKTLSYNGKLFFLDSVKPYSDFKRRLTQLRFVHPNLKYKFQILKQGSRTLFALYVRRWGI